MADPRDPAREAIASVSRAGYDIQFGHGAMTALVDAVAAALRDARRSERLWLTDTIETALRDMHEPRSGNLDESAKRSRFTGAKMLADRLKAAIRALPESDDDGKEG